MKKINLELPIYKILFLFLFIFGLPFAAYGAEYYVANSGNDITGDGSIGNPWENPAYGASQMTSDGDVLYIRGGVYDISTPNFNRSAAIYPRANNCTIAAYLGESVTLRGGINGSNFGIFPTGGVIGAIEGYSGLIIDNLTIQGMVMFDGNSAGTRESMIRNCDLSVGGDGWSGTSQGAVIWLDDAVNVRVYNNKVHDNDAGAESGVPANNGLMMMYDCSDCEIENNEFYNSVGSGITMKDDIENVILSKNFIHDNAAAGIWTGNNLADSYEKSGDIYQNIIANNNTSQVEGQGGVTLVIETSLLNIYNNTFHRNHLADLMQGASSNGVPFTFYNNISYVPRAYHLAWPYATSAYYATYMDYNNYYNDLAWRYQSNEYSSLTAWQASCQALLTGCDSNSIITDPNFVNLSGNWTVTSDYKRISYPNNGRGGLYPAVMGAYITGSEIIGYSEIIDIISPNSPTGLNVL